MSRERIKEISEREDWRKQAWFSSHLKQFFLLKLGWFQKSCPTFTVGWHLVSTREMYCIIYTILVLNSLFPSFFLFRHFHSCHKNTNSWMPPPLKKTKQEKKKRKKTTNNHRKDIYCFIKKANIQIKRKNDASLEFAFTGHLWYTGTIPVWFCLVTWWRHIPTSMWINKSPHKTPFPTTVCYYTVILPYPTRNLHISALESPRKCRDKHCKVK